MSQKEQGCAWEKRFDEECKACGVSFIQAGKDKWTPIGFRAPQGVIDRILFFGILVSFVDLKSFKDQDCIRFSDINKEQLDALIKSEGHGHRSGYVTYFLKQDAVVFFPASKLGQLGPGSSINGAEGEYLGTIREFALGNLFSQQEPFKLV